MADRPILFSAPMVAALIAGTKTQTRRLLKPQPVQNAAGLWTWSRPGVSVQGDALELAIAQRISVGDQLYVRESWRGDRQVDGVRPGELSQGEPIYYEAGGGMRATGSAMIDLGKLRPGIHMPRWASRLTLKVTEVRAERLLDIGDDDVTAEGCRRVTSNGMNGWEYHGQHWMTYPDGSNACCFKRAQDSYRQLWELINGAGSWDANPWVIAYTFTVRRGNVDGERCQP